MRSPAGLGLTGEAGPEARRGHRRRGARRGSAPIVETARVASSSCQPSSQLAARGPGPGEALAGALRDQVALDLGEQREERGHDLGLDVALAVDADVLLERHEGDPRLGEGVEDGHDLTQRPAEPGKFAHDQAVAALQDARQLVESPAFLGRLSGGGRLDEVVDAEVVRSRVLEDGEALAAHVLLRGRNPQSAGSGSPGSLGYQPDSCRNTR